jgi:hypothetical protein
MPYGAGLRVLDDVAVTGAGNAADASERDAAVVNPYDQNKPSPRSRKHVQKRLYQSLWRR